jgi:hypothetical protein
MSHYNIIVVDENNGDIIADGKFSGGIDECQKFTKDIKEVFFPTRHVYISDTNDKQIPLI